MLEEVAGELEALSGRRYGAVEPYELDGADAAVVCMGSTAGTVKDVVDELRAEGRRVGLLRVCSFRPFPRDTVRAALSTVGAVAVLDRADSPGGAPPLAADVAHALYGLPTILRSYVYGLGGRDLHPDEIREVFVEVERRLPDGTLYLGLRSDECPA